MIQILYALNGMPLLGGTEAVVMNYFNHIDKSRFHIDFLFHGSSEAGKENATCKYLIESGSKIFYVPPRGESYRANKREIRNVLQQNHYDIVHSHMDSSGMFFLREAKKAGIQVRVSHSHNTNYQINKGSRWKNALYHIILTYARHNLNRYTTVRIACSRLAGEWLFGNHPFIVLNNAIEIDKFKFNAQVREEYRKALGISDRLVIGHVGRFAAQKNHEFLIDIFNEVLKIEPKAILLSVGEGELKEQIMEKVNSLGITDNVLFLGARNDVEQLMQAMDVFLLPSKFEGLAVVLVEAQTSGLPCVISDSTSDEAMILPETSQLSLQDSPQTWARHIVSLKHEKRGEAYLQVREKGFDINDIINQLESVYVNNTEAM